MQPPSSSFRESLERLEYRSLVRHADTPPYWLARAHIVLGQYAEGEAALSQVHDAFSKKFLSLQLAVFRRENLKQCRLDLETLLTETSGDPVMKGEVHFILGYLHLLLDEYRQSLRHHRLAAEQYEAARLPSHLASSWFNLCVGYQNLNQRDALEAYSDLLDRLAKECPIPPILHLRARNRAYWAIDSENYEEAQALLDEAIVICDKEKRLRDVGGLICAKAYVLLRLENEAAFDAMLEQYADAPFTPPHRRALNELQNLREIGIPTSRQVDTLLKRWRKADLDSSYHLYLMHCLTESLRRSGDYDSMLKLARFGGRFSLKKQQALSLVDFRYYEALGLYKGGQKEKALRLLHAYAADATEINSRQKVKKAEQLLFRWGAKGNQGTKLTLDVDRLKLTFEGRLIDLGDHPVIYRFLLILIRNAGPSPLEIVFERLYGDTFNPASHQSRFNALIERTRKLLGREKTLVRRDGKIGFAAEIEASLVTEVGQNDSAPLRRAKLVRLIRETQHPLAISDLEPLFEEGRRSLQLDLKHLLSAGVIHRAGSTRNRRYFVETEK